MAGPGWIDSHCHIQTATGGPDAALERARAAGVTGVAVVGTDLSSSEAAIALAGRHHDVRATVGLHPHDASDFEQQWPSLVALAEAHTLEVGDGRGRLAAIGEAGLDYHYLHSPVPEQHQVFRAQIRLAHRLDLPLIIHSRDAWDDTFAILTDEEPPSRTIFHCFTGGPAEAERALALGSYLSFSGIVSFKGADDVRAAARCCPADRRLVETDSPYLAPAPHRGRENEPALVMAVGAALAAALDTPVETVARETSAVAQALLGPFS